MYRHPTDAVTPAREPLGVLDAWRWARAFKTADGRRGGLLERVRWNEGDARVAELAAALPETRLVYVADREADLLALMVRGRAAREVRQVLHAQRARWARRPASRRSHGAG